MNGEECDDRYSAEKETARFGAAGFALAFVTLAYPSPQEKPPATITLDDCIAQAVRRNLGVAVQVYSSELADLALSRSREKFLPSLSFDFGNQNQNSASYSWIDAADQVSTNYPNYSAR